MKSSELKHLIRTEKKSMVDSVCLMVRYNQGFTARVQLSNRIL